VKLRLWKVEDGDVNVGLSKVSEPKVEDRGVNVGMTKVSEPKVEDG